MSTSIYSARPRPPRTRPCGGLVGGLSLQFLGAPRTESQSFPSRETTHTHSPIILCSVCIQWTLSGTPPSPRPPSSPPPWWILTVWGRFGWWDRTGCAVVGGRGGVTWLRYHQLVPPTPRTSPHTPPGMDSTPDLTPPPPG